MKINIHILFLLITLSGFFIKAEAQCPPTVTLTKRGSNVDISGNNVNLCPGEAIQLNASPGSLVTYQWSKDGSPVVDSTLVHFWAKEEGNYTVVVSGCETPSNPVSVHHKAQPIFTITSNPDPPHICAAAPIILTVNSSENSSWTWMSPASVFQTNTSPLAPPELSSNTTFMVVGIDKESNCSNTASLKVIVEGIINGGQIQSDQTICAGTVPNPITSVTLPSDGGENPVTYTYFWIKSTEGPSGPWTRIDGADQPDYSPGVLDKTTWFVRDAKKDMCDEGSSNVVTITVNEIPVINSEHSRAICSGTSVDYYPTVENGLNATFRWRVVSNPDNVEGVTPSGTGNILNVLSLPEGSSSPGTVTYKITPIGPDQTLCEGAEFDFAVTVNPTPTLTNDPRSQTICAGATTTLVNLQSNIASTRFSWEVYTADQGLNGYLERGEEDNLPVMQIFSPRTDPGTITYSITPTSPVGCVGTTKYYVITVNPSPSVTNAIMEQTICSGGTTSEVKLEANMEVPFTWTASADLVGVTGFAPSGTDIIPAQTITNTSNRRGIVTYAIDLGGTLGGCLATRKDYRVFVNPIPVMNDLVPQSICSGGTTNIVPTSSVENTTYKWHADGPTSLEGISSSDQYRDKIAQTITNTSNEPQDVTYTITPSYQGCDGIPKRVVVTVWPTPTLTTSPLTTSICSGTTTAINLTGTPVNAEFSWKVLGTDVTESGSTISQTLTNNTNSPINVVYEITTTANQCSSLPVHYTVVVNPTPIVTNITRSSTICSGDVFNLPLTSNVETPTFIWTISQTDGISGASPGSGLAISQTLHNSTNAIGTVTYSIKAKANDCEGPSISYTVTVNPVPDVNLSIPNQLICSGNPTQVVTFSTEVPGTTYSWRASPASAGISVNVDMASGIDNIESQNITSALTSQGAVTYTVTPRFGSCEGLPKEHVVAINPIPVPSITGSSTVCNGSTGNVYSTEPGMTNYIWTVTGGSMTAGGNSTSSTATVTWNTVGAHSISVNYTDANGCTASSPSNLPVIVKAIPTGEATPSSATVCSDHLFSIGVESNTGSGTTYSWSIDATSLVGTSSGSFTSNSISLSYTNIGTVPETLHFKIVPIYDGCNGITFYADVTVNPDPDITITGNVNPIVGSTESYTTQPGMSEYVWTLNPPYCGTILSGEATNSVTVNWLSSSGQICVNYKNEFGCTAAVAKCLSVSSLTVPATFDVTPTTGIFCEGSIEGEGAIIGLSNSQIGIKYELIGNGGVVWDTKTGSNGALNFTRRVYNAGTYRIKATNTLSGIEVWMNRSCGITEVKYPSFSISSPDQHFCAGEHTIGISGTELDVKYWLALGGIVPDTVSIPGIHGTGDPDLNFGNPANAGAYRIYAARNNTGCGLFLQGTNWIEPAPVQFKLMPSGEFCEGEIINYWLSGSQTGFKYELHNKTTNDYPGTFIGNGGIINFGPLNTPGIYEVIATDIANPASTFCQSVMENNVTVHSNPRQNYMISPDGHQCEGIEVTLPGSESGIWYHLYRMQSSTLPYNDTPFSSRLGTGSSINFGVPAEGGLYRIMAVNRWNNLDSCSVWLPGSIELCKRPLVKDISPFGHVCEVSEIRILNPQPGVTYELIKNDNYLSPYKSINADLLPVVFTPNLTQKFEPGTYTVRAVSSCEPNSCDRMMNGQIIVDELAPWIVDQSTTICSDSYFSIRPSDLPVGLLYTWSAPQISPEGSINGGSAQLSPQTTIHQLLKNNTLNPAIATYTVTPVNGSCTGRDFTVTVTVKPKPSVANITGAICNGSAFSFSPEGVPQGTVYTWSAPVLNPLNSISGAGAEAVQQTSVSQVLNNLITGLATATYNVTPSANNCTGESFAVKVAVAPQFQVNVPPDQIKCGGDFTDPVIFSIDSPVENITYNWTNSEPAIGMPNSGTGNLISFKSVNNGNNPLQARISVTPVYTNGDIICPGATQSFGIKVFPKFIVGSVSSDQSICYKTTPQKLSGVGPTGGDGNFSYRWQYSTDDGNNWSDVSSGGNSLNYQPGILEQTTKFRQVQSSNYCGSLITNTVTVEVRIPAVTTGPNDTICGLVPYILSQAKANYAALYSWSSTGTGTFTDQYVLNGTYFPSPADMNAGGVKLILTISDECGNVKRDTMTLVMGQLPAAYFSYETPVCSNAPVSFIDQSRVSAGFIKKWVWDFGDGTINTIYFPNNPNVSHTYSTQGTVYNVKLRVYTSLGCNSEFQQLVTVLKAPTANYSYSNIDCDNQPVQFANTTQINGGSYLQPWHWDFGDPLSGSENTSALKNPIHQFSKSGGFDVKLIVQNSNNCTDTITKTVNIKAKPTVDYTFGTTCLNSPVDFNLNTSKVDVSSISKYSWDFGDGINSNLQNTTHVYTAPGTYEVSLTLTDNFGCTNSNDQLVTINPLPNPHFYVSRVDCTTSTAYFNESTSTSTGHVVRWNWDFGDGKTQAIDYPGNPNINHLYSKPGTYHVTLTIQTSDNCSNSEIQTVKISPTPIAGFDYRTNCNDMTYSFINLSKKNGGGNIVKLEWNFDDTDSGVDNSSAFENPTHLFSRPGSYNVKLVITNSEGCENTFIQTVIVTERLVADFTPLSTWCEGDTVAFTNKSTTPVGTAIVSYLWDFGDNVTSTLASPKHFYAAYGTYTVTLKIVNSYGCISYKTQQLMFNHKPVADFSVTELRCLEKPVTFTDHSFVPIGNNNFITTWVWDFGDGSVPVKIEYPSSPNIDHIFNPGAATYKVKLNVTTSLGCSSYREMNLAINTAGFTGTYGPYCIIDLPVTLSAFPADGTFSGPGVQGNHFNPVDAGVGLHTINYTSPSGTCPVDPIIINVVSEPAVRTNPQKVNSCNDTADLTLPEVTAGSTPGLYFTYFEDDQALNLIDNPKKVSPGTYYIKGSTLSGKCYDIKPVKVTQTDTLKAKLSSVSPSCSGSADGSITVIITKGRAPYTYLWNTNPVQTTKTINNLKSGIYTVVITDANMCSTVLTDTLRDHPDYKIYITHKDILCPGDANGTAKVDSMSFKGNTLELNSYTYKWNTTPVQTTREALRLSNRYYSVTLTDSKGCGIKDSVYIDMLDVTPPTIECGKDTVTIVIQADNIKPLGNDQNTISVDLKKPVVRDNCGIALLTNDAPLKFRPGITEVVWTVTDFVGLTDTCKQIIYIKVVPVIPKLFSPNGDGINDFLQIDGLKDFPKSQLAVYTRSGQLVFSSPDYHNEWDGRFATSTWSRNKIVAPGVYYYILNLGGTTQKLKGFIYIYY